MSSKRNDDYEIKRKEERTELIGDVSILDPNNPDKFPDEGVLFNISKSGAAFYSHYEIEVESILEIEGEGIWSGIRQASVRWCRKMEEGLYQVGLSFFNV